MINFSYDDIQKVAEPDQILDVLAPNMPEGQRRQVFWGEFSEDWMVVNRLKREGIVPPVQWRVTVEDKNREGFWDISQAG
jgi:hypothetical protein